MTGSALGAVLDDFAVELDGVERDATGDGTMTWSRGDRAFAIRDGASVELRLDRTVADAALRTPETEPSRRGPEWVRYTPASLEGHDLDRLEAWFEVAYRRAAPIPRT